MITASSNLLKILLVLIVLCLAGCGSGVNPESTSGSGTGPSIVSQPTNQSVPMGLTGTFAVQASGSNLQYQWSLNGSPIAGATASTYTTPATVFSDAGSVFTVTVSNAFGSATSNPASLTVTSRAPKPGDLRFQQVDAASTVNGYTILGGSGFPVFCPIPGQGSISYSYPAATGTGYFLGNLPCVYPNSQFALPIGVSGLDVGYSSGPMEEYQDVLNAPSEFSFPGPSDPGSVITSLSFVQSSNSFALGFIHGDTSSGFNPMQYTVPATGLQALATLEGLGGRVLTAISYDGTQATVYSYGWTGDPSAVYEAKVAFATISTAISQIQALAADGYILTATGSTQAADGSGVILVGTRVQGDTMPRPLLIGDVFAGTVDPVLAQGYAIVAVVDVYQNNVLVQKNYIGER